jgi:hypothetical protein
MDILKIVQKHLKERDSINEELKKVMGYCDDSPIHLELERQFSIDGDSLYLQADENPLSEDAGNYYSYTISSLGAKGEELFMGEIDEVIFVMVYPEDENWDDTTILILNLKNQVERE